MKKIFFIIILLYWNIAYSQPLNRNDSIRKLLDMYQYPLALELINKQLEINSNDVSLHLLKGNALKGLLKYSDAIHAYETTLSIDSGNNAALIETANVYKLLGDYNKSLGYLVKANKLRANNISIKVEIANTLFFLENFDEAKNIYLNLYTIDTSKTFLLRNIARCYDRLNNNDSTIYYLEKSLKNNASDYQSIVRLCNLYIKMKSYQKGIDITELYKKYETSNQKINSMNAYLYLLNKNYEEAVNRFNKCIKDNDTSGFVQKFTGISYFNSENYDTAKIYLEKAFAKDSTDAQTSHFLGIVCSLANFPELGIQYLNTLALRFN
jgi:tetratricopeptide (TPR) repeat protein